MKYRIQYLILAAFVLAPACQREAALDTTAAKPGSLLASIAEESMDTRTSFDSYDGKFVWDDGDQIAVFLTDGQSFHEYDIASIQPVVDAVSGLATTGTFLSSTTVTKRRAFYAVYPADIKDPANYGDPTLNVILPSAYDITSKPRSDYSPVPMIALNDPDAEELTFYHMGGLLRITCAGLDPAAKTIKVTFDKDVTGTYAVSGLASLSTSTPSPYISTTAANGNNTVVFTIASSEDTVDPTDRYVLNLPLPCGTFESVEITVYGTDDATGTILGTHLFNLTPLVIDRHHGKKLSFGELDFSFTLDELPDTEVTYSGGDVTVLDFKSFKTVGGSSVAASFKLVFSEKNADGTWKDWSNTPPSWITFDAGTEFTGSVSGEDIVMHLSEQEGVLVDPHGDILKARTPKANADLSRVNVATGATVKRTTANCYVVQAPGTYRIPLVYGNGIVGGAKNPSAYRAKNASSQWRPDNGDEGYYGSYKDHLNKNIYNNNDAKSSPYLTTHLQKAAEDFTPVLLWTDVEGLIDTDSSTFNITGSGEDTYIHFKVPADKIAQGNALIGVKVGGKIAWSWHIWVTDEDMTSHPAGSNGYAFSPVNLGWVEGTYETYDERVCRIRAVQSDTGSLVSERAMILTQNAYVKTITLGNNPFYQWGRKDPMQASVGYTNKRKQYYPTEEEGNPYYPVIPHPTLGHVSIGTAIQNPHVFFTYAIEGEHAEPFDWNNTVYYNPWNSTINGSGASVYDKPVTKTIYDPSPVGFKVSPFYAFDLLTESDFPWIPATQTRPAGRGNSATPSLFLPATGNLNRDSGNIANVGELAYYWMANAHSTGYGSQRNIELEGINNKYGGSRSFGRCVRPVVE